MKPAKKKKIVKEEDNKITQKGVWDSEENRKRDKALILLRGKNTSTKCSKHHSMTEKKNVKGKARRYRNRGKEIEKKN